MRVVVVGATGMLGRLLLSGLASDKLIGEVVNISDAETSPLERVSGQSEIEHRRVNLSEDLSDHFRFSDAVVFAGWLKSSCRDSAPGTCHLAVLANVSESLARAGVRAFVHGSSVGAYSVAPAGMSIQEDWPTLGMPSSRLSLQMAQGERLVDKFESDHEVIRVVRLRAGLVVCPGEPPAGWWSHFSQRLMARVAAGRRVRFVPDLGSHVIQVVHASDLVNAFRLAITESVVGSFNVVADPITSDMLAEAFKARKVRVSLGNALRVLSYSRRFGLHAMDPENVRIAVQSPLLSTQRAQSELGWSFGYSGAAMLEAWAHSLASVAMCATETDTDSPIESAPAADYRALYHHSLAFFGQLVHAVQDTQWKDVTEYRGWNVWQLVALVAREQYRTVLRLRGETQEEIERNLPGDPLGVSRVDGWDLAAERGRSVWTAEVQAAGSVVDRVLPDVICDVTLWGCYLARAIGFDGTADPDLARFVRDRMRAFDR